MHYVKNIAIKLKKLCLKIFQITKNHNFYFPKTKVIPQLMDFQVKYYRKNSPTDLEMLQIWHIIRTFPSAEVKYDKKSIQEADN